MSEKEIYTVVYEGSAYILENTKMVKINGDNSSFERILFEDELLGEVIDAMRNKYEKGGNDEVV